eukprot:3866730-Amphidinium_carterae.2
MGIALQEAEHIMNLAEGRWGRSTVSTGKRSAASLLNDLLYKPLQQGARDERNEDTQVLMFHSSLYESDRPPDIDVTPDKVYIGKAQVGVEVHVTPEWWCISTNTPAVEKALTEASLCAVPRLSVPTGHLIHASWIRPWRTRFELLKTVVLAQVNSLFVYSHCMCVWFKAELSSEGPFLLLGPPPSSSKGPR